jgi:DNA-binding HxlR family transcriptional regulator
MFDENDNLILRSIARGDFLISGFDNKNLRVFLKGLSPGEISRLLKRLRLHGLIKKIGKTYRYYITALGRQVILMVQKLKELVIIPELALCQNY